METQIPDDQWQTHSHSFGIDGVAPASTCRLTSMGSCLLTLSIDTAVVSFGKEKT
jgi:hypothetical protein